MHSKSNSTKYQPPKVLPDYFVRKELCSKLNKNKRLSFITASSGYGKSSLVSHWVQSQAANYLWINLDHRDDNLSSFIEVLIEGLLGLEVGFHSKLATIVNRSELHNEEELIAELVAALLSAEERLVIVLDDYHLMTDNLIHDLIIQLVEGQSERIQLKIIARFDTPLPIVVWGQEAWMQQIRTHDLMFRSEDTQAYLRSDFDELQTDLSQELTTKMDGWITGIRLVVFNLTTIDQLNDKLEKLNEEGSKDIMTLANWCLKQLDAEAQEVALRLSLFDHFSKGLIQALYPIAKSNLLLDGIVNSKLLVIGAEKDEGWFRFHHLFHEALKNIAESHFSKEEKIDTVTKGALFFAENGEEESAIELLLSIGFMTKAIDIFSRYRQELLDQRRWGVFERILYELFSLEPSNLQIQLSACWMHIRNGQTKELFEQLEKTEKEVMALGLKEEQDPTWFAEYYSLKSYWTYNVDRNYDTCIYECEYALKNLTKGWLYPRGYAWVFLLGGLQVKGEMSRVEDLVSSVINNPLVSKFEKGYILFVCCYLYWMELDLFKMRSSAEALIELGVSQNNKELEAHGWHFKILYGYHRGEWDDAYKWMQSNDAIMSNGIGVVRVFYDLSKGAIMAKKQAAFSNRNYHYELLNKAYVQRNEAQSIIIRSKAAELEMLNGEIEKAYLMIKELGDQPYYPLSNSVDFHLVKINCYLSSDRKERWTQCLPMLDDLEERYATSHNTMGAARHAILKSVYCYHMDQRDAALSWMNKALELSVQAEILSIFVESNITVATVLTELKSNTPYNSFIDKILKQMPVLNIVKAEMSISIREKDIIDLMIKKLSNKEIGEQLFISEKTVKNHSNSIFKKLGVKNRREAAQRAIELSLYK